MRKLIGYLGVALIAAVFVLGILAYFVVSFNPSTKQYFDGLGRPIEMQGWLVQFLTGVDRSAGPLWEIVDSIVFFGGLSAGFTLCKVGFDEKKAS